MIKIAVEPEMKGRYLKLTKHLLLATILILIIEAFGYMFFMHENFEHTKIVALIFGPGLFPSYLIMYIYI